MRDIRGMNDIGDVLSFFTKFVFWLIFLICLAKVLDGFISEEIAGPDDVEIVENNTYFIDTYTQGQHLVLKSRFTNNSPYEIHGIEYVVEFYDCVRNDCEFLMTRNYKYSIGSVEPGITSRHYEEVYSFDLPRINGNVKIKVKDIKFTLDRGWF